MVEVLDDVNRLRSALQAAERERDASYEAHAATIKTVDAERAWRDQERTQRDAAVARADKAERERDEARDAAGKLAELTGKLVVAEVEVGRLRELTRDFMIWGEALQRGRELSPESIDRLVARARKALEPKEVARVALSTEGADDG